MDRVGWLKGSPREEHEVETDRQISGFAGSPEERILETGVHAINKKSRLARRTAYYNIYASACGSPEHGDRIETSSKLRFALSTRTLKAGLIRGECELADADETAPNSRKSAGKRGYHEEEILPATIVAGNPNNPLKWWKENEQVPNGLTDGWRLLGHPRHRCLRQPPVLEHAQPLSRNLRVDEIRYNKEAMLTKRWIKEGLLKAATLDYGKASYVVFPP
ncbi:hypothetical protein B0H19DRAFT_1057239 [Mycena capillaripes]|nr:hypothetical protein B0H19DRAFT_1057239 [Mycena capillaripes]